MARKMVYHVLLAFLLLTIISVVSVRYEPNWDSLDSRPLPAWYDAAKIGIFIHWGVFSVPSVESEWFWWDWEGAKTKTVVDFMKANYPPDFTYADFAKNFKAEFFNASEWADIFQASGAQYIVLTSKHHEGFTNWPSRYSFNWNSQDVGPARDLVGELAAAIRNNTDMFFGLYHSLFEWFHPLYLQDKANKWQTQKFVESKTMPELYEIVNRYKPDVIWSDGDWEAPDTYWNSTNFIAWLYNDSPVKDSVVTNDRWGQGIMCKHGGFLTCSDRYNPGKLQKRKWENAMTIDKQSWGYRRNTKLSEFLTTDELVGTLVETVSCGGNMLVNVGPTSDGKIIPVFEERLRELGQWLKVNSEAIYGSHPWTYQNDTVTPNVWYTSLKISMEQMLYAIFLDWPTNKTVHLGVPKTAEWTTVYLVGREDLGPVNFTTLHPQGVVLEVPQIPTQELPCQWAWTFVFQGVLQ
nr:alpha-L-fucosidase isoform X1 [Crassostrea gigas]